MVQIAGLPADDDDASLTRVGGLAPPLPNRAQAPAVWDESTGALIRLEARDANGNPAAGLRMWVEAQTCWVSGRVFTLAENGQVEFYATAGTDPEAPCVLTARYADELEDYVPPRLELSQGRYSAPQLLRLEGAATAFIMSPAGQTTWRLVEENGG